MSSIDMVFYLICLLHTYYIWFCVLPVLIAAIELLPDIIRDGSFCLLYQLEILQRTKGKYFVDSLDLS